MKAVDQANEQALDSLDEIRNVTGLVKTVTGVLTLVDKAIDIAQDAGYRLNWQPAGATG